MGRRPAALTAGEALAYAPRNRAMGESGSDQLASARTGEVTSLLRRWRAGDDAAIDALAPLVYDELKRLARSALRGSSSSPTVQPTALVHELFVRLLGRPALDLRDRHHFFALAAKMLRQVLVDQARARQARKRGGGCLTVDAAAVGFVSAPLGIDLLDLDRALEKLRRREPEIERLVEVRFFAGLTIQEAAVVLSRSEASLARDWALARAFLYRELRGAASE
jgi:RNA polymerase sigma factor (TIGR02999 family)